MNVWSPAVTEPYEFSLSQLWVISGSFGNDLNTIEAGWQVTCYFRSLKINKNITTFEYINNCYFSRLAQNYMEMVILDFSLIGL